MELIRKNPVDCQGCPLLCSLSDWCYHYVPGVHFDCETPGHARLLTLAEAPASWEKRQGRPLAPRGSAGRVFHLQLAASGLAETPRYLANVVMCTNLEWIEKKGKWETRNPPPEAVKCCAPKWQRLIEIVQPEVILLLGKTALKAFGMHFGRKEDGRRETIYDVAPAGVPLVETGWAPYIVATYHPSGLYGKEEDMPRRIKHFQESFELAARLLDGA